MRTAHALPYVNLNKRKMIVSNLEALIINFCIRYMITLDMSFTRAYELSKDTPGYAGRQQVFFCLL